MPTNPRPTSLFEIVRRAVEVAHPDDADGRLGDFLLQFEDDDEPVAGVLDELERLVAEAAAFGFSAPVAIEVATAFAV